MPIVDKRKNGHNAVSVVGHLATAITEMALAQETEQIVQHRDGKQQCKGGIREPDKGKNILVEEVVVHDAQ